ncbi:MAG: hypothetical protein HY831_00955 [Candidatus Aenigmarchaeota archaeon]|nr:hypothetical protein [Candidatus Aenigmarchaeota archaeon]
MKKLITALVLGIVVLSMPFAFAQQIGTQSTTKASVETLSSLDLKFKQIGQGFGDFVYNTRSALTFDESAKLDLLKERNLEMKERQQAWLDVKSEALSELNTKSVEEKENIISSIQSEHEAIVKEHTRLTSEIKNIELDAKANGDTALEEKAKTTVRVIENSGISAGLNVPVRGHTGLSLLTSDTEEGKLTADEAAELVKEKLGFKVNNVETVTESGSTFFVVTASDVEAKGGYTLTKMAKVKIDSNTGTIISITLDTNIDLTTNLGIGLGAKSKTEVETDTSTGESSSSSESSGEVSFNNGVSSSLGTSGSASVGIDSSTDTGVESQGNVEINVG